METRKYHTVHQNSNPYLASKGSLKVEAGGKTCPQHGTVWLTGRNRRGNGEGICGAPEASSTEFLSACGWLAYVHWNTPCLVSSGPTREGNYLWGEKCRANNRRSR